MELGVKLFMSAVGFFGVYVMSVFIVMAFSSRSLPEPKVLYGYTLIPACLSALFVFFRH